MQESLRPCQPDPCQTLRPPETLEKHTIYCRVSPCQVRLRWAQRVSQVKKRRPPMKKAHPPSASHLNALTSFPRKPHPPARKRHPPGG
jgi:hypothetical protein